MHRRCARRAPAFAALSLVAFAGAAQAGAWTQPKGQGQVIVKYEAMRGVAEYDAQGHRLPLPATRRDRAFGVLAEYGLSDGLTVQLKGEHQTGRDGGVDYSGLGPTEIGLSWRVWRDDRTSVSLYSGYAQAGEGRNAGYAAPGQGDGDVELRLSVGHAFDGPGGRWGDGRGFVEVQAARRLRDGLPDETRVDLTLGAHLDDDWMVLGQVFAGQTDGAEVRWASVETSLVRRFGRWSLQAGWRQAVAGRRTPDASGPVLALWRRF